MSEIKRSADSVSEASELSANPQRSAAAEAQRGGGGPQKQKNYTKK
jgi:hypothetical protein